MSERLEQINEKFGNYKTETMKGMQEMCLDFNWLIEQAERVEELEGNIKRHKDVNVELCKRIAELEMKYENTGSMFGRQNQRLLIEENTRLREALKFYADKELYKMGKRHSFMAMQDNGKTARTALEREPK